MFLFLLHGHHSWDVIVPIVIVVIVLRLFLFRRRGGGRGPRGGGPFGRW